MAESDFHQIEKLIPYKAKPKSRAGLEEGEMVRMSNVKDTSQLEPSASFKAIYSSFLNETAKVQGEVIENQAQGENLKLAMEEAKNAFNSMMEIREQLNQAYKEFMQMT